MAVCVGVGYDSHRFGEDRPLILGGVQVPFDRGLIGHSDADVLTHAITDAVMGAGGLGDIGEVFPDSDPQWKDADSIGMLRTVVGMLRGPIINVDATVICEEPKLSAHKAEITALLEEVTSARITIKATTNEGMGWIGRGEGIAAIAVASVDIS